MLKKPVFNVKLKLFKNVNFSQFHEHIFINSRTQMFFKVGAFKNFTILRIKKRLQHRCSVFSCKKQTLGDLLKKCVLFCKLMLTY